MAENSNQGRGSQTPTHPENVTIDGLSYGVAVAIRGDRISRFMLFDALNQMRATVEWDGVRLTEEEIERVFRASRRQRLNTSQGRREFFSGGYRPIVSIPVLGGIGSQEGWDDYEAITPNLDRKGVRRVDQHIGFDAAWELLAPLVNAEAERADSAEAKLDELKQYRQMLLDAGDGQWDPELVAADLRHILLGPSSTAAAPASKRDPFDDQGPEGFSVASEEEVRENLRRESGDGLDSAAPSSVAFTDLKAAAVEGARDQVEHDRQRSIATAQWIKDLAATYDRPVAVVSAQEGSTHSMQGLRSALDALADGNDGKPALGAESATSGLSTDTDGAPVELSEPEWEYGWRSFFEGSGDEYEWLACSSREEAEELIEEYQAEEDEERAQFPDALRLVYSLWKRVKVDPSPWIRV